MENFKMFTTNFVEMSENELSLLQEVFQPIKVKKMDHVFAAGSYVTELFFFDSGVFRAYALKDGEEFTTKFLFGPTIYAELFSIRKHQPTFLNIQALSDCECYKANFIAIERLMIHHPGIRRLFLKLYENIYMTGVKRQVSFMIDSQAKRYTDLIAENPKILEQVPLQYIASFLGVKPETLSRIRKGSKNL
ncbi:Crp/Fnr family transcriptional regulator [Flavobacterium phycosphaerae]|uniref:Crp/Fnr family transcriptional regulator n=1 Tax=Flavobacterium phycosphaerae TaxID=2697515 RepID=UPI001389C615|nr:Crp/Fnr family transcriptional regulator [Flavobacterium phycosphaerae]